MPGVRCDVQVAISVTVVVEYHDRWTIVAHLIAVLQRFRRNVGERRYVRRFLLHALRTLLQLRRRIRSDYSSGYGGCSGKGDRR